MRRKPVQFRKMVRAVWKERGSWYPTYVVNQQHASGVEYQHFMLDANDKLVCAGVTRHTHMNRAQANQIYHVWRRWRNEYDTRFDGVGREYPARGIDTPVRIVVHPIGDHTAQESYSISRMGGN